MTRGLDSVRGYAVIFGAVSDPTDWLRDGDVSRMAIARGAASWMRTCTLNCDHAEGTAVANVRDGTLRIWQDTIGVSFEADIPCTVEGMGYRAMLSNGGAFGASPLFQIYGRDVEGEGPDRIETVTRCALKHISVTASPAFPQTSAWLASQPVESLAPDIRASARRWNLGKLAPIEEEIPNPEWRYDASLRRHVLMSDGEREARYRRLCEMRKRSQAVGRRA